MESYTEHSVHFFDVQFIDSNEFIFDSFHL